MKFVKGETDKARFKSIDRTLTHFSKKLHNTVVALATPIPISCSYDVLPPDGVVMAYMFPGSGTLTRAVIYVGGKIDKKKPLVINSIIASKDNTAGKIFETKRQLSVIDLDTPVAIGDRLIITVDDPETISRLWVSLLWRPEISEVETKQFLLDELHKLEDNYALSGEGEDT